MISAFARGTMVGAAGGEPSSMEALDGLAVRSLERDVGTTRRGARRGGALQVGDEQLVRPEETRALAAERHSQCFQDRQIKALAARQVRHAELQVIDQPP